MEKGKESPTLPVTSHPCSKVAELGTERCPQPVISLTGERESAGSDSFPVLWGQRLRGPSLSPLTLQAEGIRTSSGRR